MHSLLHLWRDDHGFLVSTELALVATILVIGIIVAWTSVRDQVIQELADFGGMVSQMNQSFSFSAITGHHSSTAGSFGVDLVDSCDVSCGDQSHTTCDGALCVSMAPNATHET
jgi:hypothetical protein